ncbi:MAG: hypothetical protein M0R76_06665 [Proteobacteria bacterium]|nr:hypothetical protein [Pseudomonadota bacterium]NLN61521.1 hypothetical protein [Myxococcales bacterium]
MTANAPRPDTQRPTERLLALQRAYQVGNRRAARALVRDVRRDPNATAAEQAEAARHDRASGHDPVVLGVIAATALVQLYLFVSHWT